MRLTAYFNCALIALPLNLFAQLQGDALAIVNAINENTGYLRTVVDNTGSEVSILENMWDEMGDNHSDLVSLLNLRFTDIGSTIAVNTTRLDDRLRTMLTDLDYIRAHNNHIAHALYESYDGNGTGRTIFHEVRDGFRAVTNLLMRNIQAMQPVTLLTNIYAAQLGISDVYNFSTPTVNGMLTNSLAYGPGWGSALYSKRDAFQPVWFLPWSDTEYEPEISQDPDLTVYLDNIYQDVVYDLKNLPGGGGDHWGYDGVGISYYKLYGTLALRQAIDGTATNMMDATLPEDDVFDAQIAKGKEVIKEQTGDDEPETYYQVDPVEEKEDSTFKEYFDELRRMGTDDSDYKSISDELEDKIKDVSSSIDSILPSRRPGSGSDASGLVIPYNIDLSGIFGSVEDLPSELGTLSGQIDLTVSPQDIRLFHYGFTLVAWVVKVSMFFYTGIQLFNYLAAGLAGKIAQEKAYRDALDEI